MVRFYVAKTFDDGPVLPFLSGYFGRVSGGSNLYITNSDSRFLYEGFSTARDIGDCDFVVIPQGIRRYEGEKKEYVNRIVRMAAEHGKKVIVFTAGDLHHDVFIPDAIVFKALNYSRYRKENEIYIPVYVEDLLAGKGIEIRKKDHPLPIIGFCGWAGFRSLREAAIYHARNLTLNIRKLASGDSSLEVFKKGVYFRRKCMRILKRSPLVETNFIARMSYSANAATISLPPEIARREFVDNIIGSDFVLAPKGDGNSSARFYEALSIGRIPVLIDTEMIMPLEGVINYSAFTLRVPYEDIGDLPRVVRDFYDGLTPHAFEKMQHAAREAFEKHLRYDSFLNYVFRRLPRLLEGESIDSFLRE